MNALEWLKSQRESLVSVIELEDVHSKDDPADRPYRSQYAARDILQGLVTDLDQLISSSMKQSDPQTYLLYFCLAYRLANNFMATEETHAGEEIINSIYGKIESIPQIESYLRLLENKSSSKICSGINASGEQVYDVIPWINSLSGILMRIYNTMGMLWASKIMNQIQESISELDDLGFLNSFKYLSLAKNIYKRYKCQFKKDKSGKELLEESGLEYDPPECIDSLLLDYLNYETPYLRNECCLSDNVERKESVKLDIFESDYTSTLFLLAQAFGKMSSYNSLKHKSAKYCYKTLSRQLNSLKYDPVEWALNAATLSQYYVMEGGFKRARHCIAASQIILKEAIKRPTLGPNHKKSNVSDVKEGESKLNKEIDEETRENTIVNTINNEIPNVSMDCQKTADSIIEESLDTVIDQMQLKDNESKEGISRENSDKNEGKRLHPDPMSESRFWDDDVYEEKRVQAKADIGRCWIKFGITLLENSFQKFMPDNMEQNDNKIENNDVNFPEFNIELDYIEKQVSYDHVDSFEEARELFLFVQRQINEAREYYKIDYRCSDAIELICDHSKAFKALSQFETSVERKCCMHKKRIDMLTELLGILNQNYYQVQCRTMMLEVGEIYSTMIALKTSLIESSTTSTESLKSAKGVALKIRRLAHSGIDIYQKFLDSYRSRDNIMPEVFQDDDIRPVMIAHFYMARIYSKIIEPDVTTRVSYLRKSLDHYKFIVTYCELHSSAAKLLEGELESCRDMVVLLPHKIHKILL